MSAGILACLITLKTVCGEVCWMTACSCSFHCPLTISFPESTAMASLRRELRIGPMVAATFGFRCDKSSSRSMVPLHLLIESPGARFVILISSAVYTPKIPFAGTSTRPPFAPMKIVDPPEADPWSIDFENTSACAMLSPRNDWVL